MTDVAAPRRPARREHRARTGRSRRVNQPACSRAGMGRYKAGPSRLPVASADLAEELPYVAGQQVSCFQGGEVAATEVDPMDDNRGSAEYKRELVKVLVRRAGQEALQRPA